MPRLDPLIESLLCENGTELRFETGAGVRLALPAGTILPIEKPLSTKQILASIAELAPAGVAGTLAANRDPVTFPYRHPKGSVMVTVRPDGDRVLVMLSPMPRAVEAAPATRPEKPPAEPARKAKPAEPRPKKKKRPLPEVEVAVELDIDDVDDFDDEEMEEEDPPRVITMAPSTSLLPRVDVARTGVHSTSMDRLLEEMIEAGASDIHFTTGFPPCFRVDGDLVAAKGWGATSL